MNGAIFHPNDLVADHALHLYKRRYMPDSLRARNIEKSYGPKLAYLAQWGKEPDEYWQNVNAEEQFDSNVLFAMPQGFDNAMNADPGDDPNENFAPDMSYSVQPDGSLHYNGIDSKRIAQTLITTRDMYYDFVGGNEDPQQAQTMPPKKKKIVPFTDRLKDVSIEKTNQTPLQA